jgi:DNA primase
LVRYVVGGSEQALLALVNLGSIAVHVMNCRTTSLATPDWLTFDLDPGSGRFADAARVGRTLPEILDDFGLRSYPKTSGARGLHVLVPLVPGADQEVVRGFARSAADLVEHRAPELATVVTSRPDVVGDQVASQWFRVLARERPPKTGHTPTAIYGPLRKAVSGTVPTPEPVR